MFSCRSETIETCEVAAQTCKVRVKRAKWPLKRAKSRILPLTLGAILVASRKKKVVGDYHHPTWMIVLGVVAVLITVIAGYFSLQGIADIWTG
ncbi:hypothetical protein GCM10009001_35320 [Virgibacillus siamensis]|uniref:Uncharacterized protein n=1 Tax=Virgibacillus siamensis TaxID=480071 RepID=A0ABN1GN47_9BACI